MKYYKRWIGDYQRDTGHLCMVEHGAYNLMLDVHYGTGRPLPRDKEALYRLLRAITKDEQAAVEAVLAQFWTQTDDGWVNDRATKEITRSSRQAETNRRIAVEREAKRVEHESCNEPFNEPFNESSQNRATNDQPTHSHSHSHSQKKATASGTRAREGPIGEMEADLARFLASLPDARARRRVEAQARMVLTGDDRKAWEADQGTTVAEAERPEMFRLALGYHADGSQKSFRSSVRYAVKLYAANERAPPDPRMGRPERKLAERIAKLQSVDLSTAFQS